MKIRGISPDLFISDGAVLRVQNVLDNRCGGRAACFALMPVTGPTISRQQRGSDVFIQTNNIRGAIS